MDPFEEIYRKYQPDVYRFLMRITGFDQPAAEELTQETFYQAFLSFGNFRGDCAMRTWLFQIAKNVYAKYIRRETRQRELTARQHDGISPAPSDELEQREAAAHLRKLIEQLDDPAKSVIQYRLFSGMSYAEIAQILGIRANTAAVIYNRTVARLRQQMKERYGYEI